MDSVEYQNMAASNGGPSGGGQSGMQAMQQQVIQQQNMQQRAMHQQIYKTLQQPPHPQAWQTAVSVGERVRNVVQLVSSLRLVKENMNTQAAMSIAMNFEHKAFQDVADKASYDAECRQKLIQIKEARANQIAKLQQHSQNAQGTQPGFAQQASMQGMMPKQPHQIQQGFPNPQLQHPMQASPLPPQIQQQQMAMGMNLANLQASGGMPQQQQANMQRQGPPQAARDDLNPFTPQENSQINLMVHKMLQSTPRAELEKKANLQNIAPELLQELARQKIDPLYYCLRREAARQVRLNKARMQAQLGDPQQSAGVNGRMATLPPGAGVMPQQARPRSQNAMNGQAQQLGGMNPNQGFDPSLMGQIIGQQQAEALRSQDAGQLVVPASNNQGMAQQPVAGPIGMKQAQTSQNPGHAGTSRAMAPNTMAQSQQQFMPQAAHMQAQSQAHARAVAQAKANQIALQGQPDLNAHIGQMALSQSPAMPNINRAPGPAGQQAKAQATPQQQKHFPQMGQPTAQQAPQDAPQPRNAMTPQLQTNNQTQGPPIPANIPPFIQQQITNLPDDQKRVILAQWYNQSRNAQVQSASGRAPMPQGPVPMQNQMSPAQMQLLGQPMPPGQATNNQVMNTPNSVFQQRPPSTQQNIAQVMMSQHELQQRSQQQQQQQQREAIRRQEIQRQHALQSLPPEKVQEMDDMEVPPGYLNAQNNTISQVPPNVRTWGHLKTWAHRNSHIMPAESLERLKALQFLHYSELSNSNHRRVAQQGGQAFPIQMVPGSMPQNYGLGPGLAPAAQMMPQGSQNGQAPLQRPMQQQLQMPPGMPPLQPPSAQEVQAARLRLPEHLKEATDEQVKTMMMKMRMNKAMNQFPNSMKGPNTIQLPGAQTPALRAQQHEPQQQAPQQALQQGPGELQQNRRQPNQTNLNARMSQEQQLQRSRPLGPTQESKAPGAQGSAKSGKPAPQRRVGAVPQPQVSQDQKNLKRSSYDDVVEVPNPNLSHTQPAQQVKPEQSQPERRPPTLGPTAEQLASMPPKQRAHMEARMRDQAQMANPSNLSNGGQQGQAPLAENRAELERQIHEFERKDARLKQIIQEVVQNSPKRQPIDMSPEIKAMMAQKLHDAKAMVLRMEKSLPLSFRTSVLDEKTTRELISTRVLLVQQYQGTEYNPLDRFTISPEELDTSIKILRKYFAFVYQKMLPQKQNNSQDQARQPPQSQQQAVPPPSQARMHPLNAENLQQQQQALQMARNASLQRHHSARDSRPPAAPTSSQPPFPIGAASPHGVPQAYGPNDLTQEKLNWPPAKKRKPNQPGSAASTPAQPLGTPGSAASPQLTKLASPEMQRQAGIRVDAEAMSAFKCPDDSCEYNIKGFTSQTDLDRHTTETHEMKEPHIEDPLSWALESLAHGLGLDSKGKSKMKVPDSSTTKKTAGAQNMQATPSKQGETPKPKLEAGTPVTRTTTPMARPPTQTGSSPAPSLLKTPQTTNMKTPGPAASVTKSLPKKSSKGESTATPVPVVHPPVQGSPTPPDMWADSSIRPADLLQCFSGIDTLPVIGSFAQMQASLTPASIRSGSSSSRGDKKDSPRESDISENDQLQISIAADDDSHWNPFGLYDGLTGDMEDLKFGEELVMMDWANWQEKTDKDMTVKGSGSDELQWAPSPAWDPNLFSRR